MQENAKNLSSLINNIPKNIVITTHRSPDGDAMGSSLALYHMLKKLNHQVNIITPNDYPDFLHWLPGNESVIIYEGNEEKANKITEHADIIFLLDFGNIYRIADFSDIVSKSTAIKVLIDHHEDPDEDIADIIFSKPESSATAEIVFEIISEMNMKEYLNQDIATCLYVGIMTDTGSFKYPSTTAATHKIIAALIEAGANNSKIHELIHDTSSESRMKLLGYCLNEKLLVLMKNKSAIISLSSDELDRFNFKKGDTEGVVNYALAIEGIIFAAFVIEKDGVIKLSLRSKGEFRVNEIAKKYFSGGGHINAAGGVSSLNMNQTIEKLKDITNKYSKKLNNTKY